MFIMRELKDIIFHLKIISTITDKSKIAQKAAKLEQLFWKVLIFELNEQMTIPKDKERFDDGRISSKEKQLKVWVDWRKALLKSKGWRHSKSTAKRTNGTNPIPLP